VTAKNGKRLAAAFGQDLMRGEHVIGSGERPTGLGGVTMDALSSHPRYYEQKTAAEARVGRKLTPEEFERDHWVLPDSQLSSGTSIFDPVLCELAYRWFSPPGGLVLDPFAGGSVRGIVATKLGRRYVGVDLRPEQIAANVEQGLAICGPDEQPTWIEGDSRDLPTLAPDLEADFVFSCPPYADLEVYSDDPRDLSTLDYADFRPAYFDIIAKACAMLRKDRFACFVVGDVRDKRGAYYDFVGDTVQAFRDAGLSYYNEAILVTSVGSLPIRAGRQFAAGRKLGKTHQNVLIFLKGDSKRAVAALGEVEFGDIDPGETQGDWQIQP